MTRNDRRIRCMVVKEGVIFCLWACPRRCTSLSERLSRTGERSQGVKTRTKKEAWAFRWFLYVLAVHVGHVSRHLTCLRCVLGCPRGAEDELYKRAAGQAGGLSSTASGRVPLK